MLNYYVNCAIIPPLGEVKVLKKALKIIAKILIVIIVIVGVIIGAITLFIKSKIDKINYKEVDVEDLGIDEENIPDNAPKISEEYTRFVIFGSDSRDESNEYAGRSDTIMIVVLNNIDKAVNIISIPRDTYVNVPGYGYTKINHAYAYGQEQLSLKTINSNFGLNLTQYITIDFSGLIESIDQVGGVEVNLTQEEVDFINRGVDAYNKVAGPGLVNLNGKQALVHSRNRIIGNDFTRAYRQRTILVSLLNKIVKKSPDEILALTDSLLVNLTTNMDIEKYKKLFLEVANDRQKYLTNVSSLQIPSEEYGYDYMLDGVYYFNFDMSRAKADFIKYYYLTPQE